MAGRKREARLCTGIPAIHVLLQRRFKDVDARDKPGHDELNQLSQRPLCDTGNISCSQTPQETET
jgi:hypothetical protein